MGLYKGNLNQHMSSASHKEEEKKKDVAAHVGGGTNHFLVPHLAALPPVHAAARDRCLKCIRILGNTYGVGQARARTRTSSCYSTPASRPRCRGWPGAQGLDTARRQHRADGGARRAERRRDARRVHRRQRLRGRVRRAADGRRGLQRREGHRRARQVRGEGRLDARHDLARGQRRGPQEACVQLRRGCARPAACSARNSASR